MNKLGSMLVGVLALAACSGPAAEVAPPGVKPATEAQLAEAIALARACWAREPWGQASGSFALDRDQGSAVPMYPQPLRFHVRLREGFYMGRLPSPRPLGDVWIEVDLATRSCSASTAPSRPL